METRAFTQKKLVTIFFIFLFSLVGFSQANADPYSYLNNGIISFADSTGTDDFFNESQHWQQAYLLTNPYDSSSQIRITNDSGWGVTVTYGENCYTGENNGCSRYDDDVTRTRTIDYGGLRSFDVEGGTYTYGTIVETADANLDGQEIEIVSSISLARESSYAVITTTVRNLGSTVTGLKLIVNNYDGMIHDDSDYRSTRGNVIDGSFIGLTDTNQSSNAVLADALEYDTRGKDYGALLVAGSNGGTLSSVLDQGCCDANAVVFDPESQLTQSGNDGQYAVVNQLPTLGSGQSYTLKWVFGAGRYSTLTSPAFLNEVLLAIGAEAPKPVPVPVYARQSTNLSFSQSFYGTDTLSDPDGKLRQLLDEINAKFGYLVIK